MRRRPLHIAAFAAIMLAIGVMLLRHRSYTADDHALYAWQSGGRAQAVGIYSTRLRLIFGYSSRPKAEEVGRGFQYFSDHRWSFAFLQFALITDGVYGRGFGAVCASDLPRNDPSSITSASLMVPHWFIAAALCLVPLEDLRRSWLRRRQARITAALACERCGYDLRATPDRCPECGRQPPRS